MGEEELPVDDEWRQIEQGYVETCEQVLVRGKGKQEGVVQQGDVGDNRATKGGKENTTNMARTRTQKTDAKQRYQELNREMRRKCREDRRVRVESEAEGGEEAGTRGDSRTLYEITRKLRGRLQNTCKLASESGAGVSLRSAEEEMHRWREHFQTVLNHEELFNPPEVEPTDELNIKTGRITSIEIKNAINKLAAGCENIPQESIKTGGDSSEVGLLDLCNRVWSEEKIPEEWKKGLLIKLPKKGYCKIWSDIMLLKMASKVFCKGSWSATRSCWITNWEGNRQASELAAAVRIK